MKNRCSRLALVLLLNATIFAADANADAAAAPAAGGTHSRLSFVTTQDGSPLLISSKLFNTKQARKFLHTGKNPYLGNQAAIDQGKKIFELWSCTACHGGNAQGQIGPSLHGPNFHYPKDATDKGMFETIWHGTNGGMGAKGIGLMDPTDASNGLTPDDVLKVISWVRSLGANP
ncbi:cytochrome c-L precursor [mine drainage metagenome]|uniref:Cytochrome c-L n=1 Tax=mine drainage metagenome TaxID=410659 RepID=A0A1J5QBD3_9ZZZZ